MKILLAAFACLATFATPAYSANVNLISNGTFTTPTISGSYNNCGTKPFSCGSDPSGNVLFVEDTALVEGNFAFNRYADHTGDGGYLIVVEPESFDPFFTQTFDVAANSNYEIRYFAGQLHFNTVLQVFINGSPFANQFVPAAGPGAQWSEFAATYNSGSNTSVTFSIASVGDFSALLNDFVIDDMSFVGPVPTIAAPVPEPTTWAMMIVGFGAVGAGLRASRRRLAVAASARD